MPIGRHRDLAQLEARAGRGLDQGEHRPCLRGRQSVRWSRSRSSTTSSTSSGPVDDRVLDRADALDLAADAVARLEEDRRVAEDADARRRAGRDDVAGSRVMPRLM